MSKVNEFKEEIKKELITKNTPGSKKPTPILDLLDEYIDVINKENNTEYILTQLVNEANLNSIIFLDMLYGVTQRRVTYEVKIFNKWIRHKKPTTVIETFLQEIVKRLDIKTLSKDFPNYINVKEHFGSYYTKHIKDEYYLMVTTDTKTKFKLMKDICDKYKIKSNFVKKLK
jgi:hypothetical protein